mmetsp:Transcript_5967/g.15358  ORF Transcript_5967/g.15358 Transcript_5967/m.15358 type:complete len:247 (+) Transcript_5967:1677-2417(+)
MFMSRSPPSCRSTSQGGNALTTGHPLCHTCRAFLKQLPSTSRGGNEDSACLRPGTWLQLMMFLFQQSPGLNKPPDARHAFHPCGTILHVALGPLPHPPSQPEVWHIKLRVALGGIAALLQSLNRQGVHHAEPVNLGLALLALLEGRRLWLHRHHLFKAQLLRLLRGHRVHLAFLLHLIKHLLHIPLARHALGLGELPYLATRQGALLAQNIPQDFLGPFLPVSGGGGGNGRAVRESARNHRCGAPP